MACLLCDAPLGGQQRKFCSNKCRYTYRDRHKINFPLTCAECGVGMWRTSSSAPQGQARCRACRRAASIGRKSLTPEERRQRGYDKRNRCVDCDQPCAGKSRCKPCDSAMRQANADPASLARKKQRAWEVRRAREVETPGLSLSQRRRLMAKWKRQGRSCYYCPALATTLDHVVPLARGGTHYEGNLVPCCATCNSSKLAYTVTEWRHRKRTHPRYTQPQPWVRKMPYRKRGPRQPYRSKALPVLYSCPACDVVIAVAGSRRKVTCSSECSTEWTRRRVRDQYRASVGLPWSHATPTKTWLRDQQLGLPLAG